MKKNHLSNCTSPYLLQHKDNPVDWYPWCDEALQKAKQEHKPILLSIGYSACHWCHVMAHESFEDDATAKLMNQYFINIKVDREERPDLDKLYQTAFQVLNQRGGGWPLTLFLHPDDLTVFFAGTYFPKEARYQMPSFKDVLQRIHEIFLHRETDILTQNENLRIFLKKMALPLDHHAKLSAQVITKAREHLIDSYDTVHQGFGNAPKFPQPTLLHFLSRFEDHHSQQIIQDTLSKFSQSGLWDVVGGGFFRYCVDAQWHIPHFEKMLYDNALLLNLYIDAYHHTQQPRYADTARQLITWLREQMLALEGYFYASLDADSNGIEGDYYCWQASDIKALLSEDEFTWMSARYGLNHQANFENTWHLYPIYPSDQAFMQLKKDAQQGLQLEQSALDKLKQARQQRTLPHRDEKCITAWNALMIKALYKAGFYLQEDSITELANNALAFIHKNLWVDKTLAATYKDNKISGDGFLDDYAFLLDALLTKCQYDWDNEAFNWALEIAQCLWDQFYDNKHYGFYFTSKSSKIIMTRFKSWQDEAIPSGNGIALQSLLTLATITVQPDWFNQIEHSLQAAFSHMHRIPEVHCSLLIALQQFISPPELIVIVGPDAKIEQEKQRKSASSDTIMLAITETQKTLPKALSHYKVAPGETKIFRCQGMQCKT